MEHLNAVILAGGSGTRLWPLGTPAFPKQFLPLPNGRSMIQESLARIEPVVSPEGAWVVTGRSMAELAHEHLPSTSMPSTITLPDVWRSSPLKRCTSVDLPEPVTPMMATQQPRSISRLMSESAVFCNGPAFLDWYVCVRWRVMMMGSFN